MPNHDSHVRVHLIAIFYQQYSQCRNEYYWIQAIKVYLKEVAQILTACVLSDRIQDECWMTLKEIEKIT